MILTTIELASALGVSDSAITDQVKKGMPRLRKGHRGKQSLYDFDAVLAWCGKSGFASRVDVLHRAAPPAARKAMAPRIDERAIARAIALARVKVFEEIPDWEFEAKPSELVEFADLYLFELTNQLAGIGLSEVFDILDETHQTDAAWPDDVGQIVARARGEVPQIQEAQGHG